MRNGKWCDERNKARALRKTMQKRMPTADLSIWTVTKQGKEPRFYVGVELPDYIVAKAETGGIATKVWKA